MKLNLPAPTSALLLATLCVAFDGSTAFAQSKIPDLAQLKLAAEAGDARAQFEYGTKMYFANTEECFAMILKSANQGYGPAEDSMGERYLGKYSSKADERARFQRLGVRYTSRAAFKGFAGAQARLSDCYRDGTVVPKSPVLAYTWMAIAARTAAPFGYKPHLDVLIAKTPSNVIAEGQKLADSFRPSAGRGMNTVEADVLIAQMKVNATIFVRDARAVVINQTRIPEGETRPLTIDGEIVNLKCIAIGEKSTKLKLAGFEFTLPSR